MKWIDVPPVEGCLVINTGRAMERIMNGKSVATKHRVKFTENVLRHSIPYLWLKNHSIIRPHFLEIQAIIKFLRQSTDFGHLDRLKLRVLTRDLTII